MSLEIRWTEEAEFTFDNIVSFIQGRWGERSSDKFINKTQKILLNISRQPFCFLNQALKMSGKR
jgi:plasmid stabilization system protein ParE